jgi:hypothetical protein
MPHKNISLPELLMLIAYLSFPVWCIARAIQWLMLSKVTAVPKRLVLLALSLIVSFIVTLVIWGGWPGNPMFSILSLPALCAEGFILTMTFLIKKTSAKK